MLLKIKKRLTSYRKKSKHYDNLSSFFLSFSTQGENNEINKIKPIN